ncbi:helix-turn-helix domain-containing protein, partial [bacterium]|nr:helix-turn-helix domain-containing protein [bacterium]
MRVSVRDTAALLAVSDEQIYDWIESEDLPAYKIDEQYMINRSELLEWATARKLPVSPEIFQQTEDDERIPSVSECLKRGGVFHNITGANREDVLR